MSLTLPDKSESVFLFSEKQRSFLNPHKTPKHVAVIMDGNRRWARKRSLPLIRGYISGARTLSSIVQASIELGIKVLTVYGFSTENWNRPSHEIKVLMNLIRFYLKKERKEMVKEGIRLRAIGDISRFPNEVLKDLERSIKETQKGEKMELVLALNYGSRDEIRRATTAIARDVKEGRLDESEISEDTISRYLDTADWPDPDLLIRPSGESRLSNFLLWQASYTEILITDVLWPDFSKEDLYNAMIHYQKRESRMGR